MLEALAEAISLSYTYAVRKRSDRGVSTQGKAPGKRKPKGLLQLKPAPSVHVGQQYSNITVHQSDPGKF